MNQPQVYIYPLPFEPPISLPIPPLQVDTEPLLGFPEPNSKFPLAIYFTYGNVSFHVARKEDFLLAPLECCFFCVPSNKDNDKEERQFTIIHKTEMTAIFSFSPFHFLAHEQQLINRRNSRGSSTQFCPSPCSRSVIQCEFLQLRLLEKGPCKYLYYYAKV